MTCQGEQTQDCVLQRVWSAPATRRAATTQNIPRANSAQLFSCGPSLHDSQHLGTCLAFPATRRKAAFAAAVLQTCFVLTSSFMPAPPGLQGWHPSARNLHNQRPHISRLPPLRTPQTRQPAELVLSLRTSPEDDGKYPKQDRRRKQQRRKQRTSRSFRSGTASEDVSSVEIEKTGGGGVLGEDEEEAEFEKGREGSQLGESFWMDYVMRVTADQPGEKQETPTKALEAVEAQYQEGAISEERYAARKRELMAAFWASLVEDDTIARRFKQQDISVQVCNSKQFADSWVRTHVIEAGETLVGLAVEWNSKWRVKGRRARSRISTIQVSTASSVLIVQMSLLKPLTPPPLLKQILADPRIRKVGTNVLSDALKLQKDWRLPVLARVDAASLAEELKYTEGGRANTSTVAKKVLALDYEKPKKVALGNWEAESLSDLQITCAALDGWVPRAAVAYLESLTGSKPTVADVTPPSAAL
eukprot:CAMPEP_0196737110 /NCGR_PEP_ID=MMETSP1091-20130531/14941_1 /TAXON_ID=302021 /ORGANISM="Rhodomonas sp., Strain CCMP768" /LENGTH=473 /DNA_ID=CAMNT_0042080915 /DNA_START=240 /DNA_END=1657 /DNA_ORIENTATION=-